MNSPSRILAFTFVFVAAVAMQAIAQASELAAELGVEVGMNYLSARKRLLDLGWRIDRSEDSVADYEEAPELGCLVKPDPEGSILCAASFMKDDRGLVLWVVPEGKKLVVEELFEERIINGHVR